MSLRLGQLVVSCVFLGIGVALVLRAGLGADGYSTVVFGLALTTGLPFVAANALLGGVLVALAWTRGVRPGIGTLAQPLVVGLTVSVTLPLVGEASTPLARVGLLAAAFALIVVGVAGYLASATGAGPPEAAALAFDPPVPFSWGYSILQGGGALTGWLLGADVGPGTLLIVAGIGPAVDWVLSRFRKRARAPAGREPAHGDGRASRSRQAAQDRGGSLRPRPARVVSAPDEL